MLSDDELLELFRDIESDRVERKREITDGEKIREAICAFANDLPNHRRPGIVVVGQDSDGSCANIEITERLLETLGSWRSDGRILPFPTMSVARRTVDGCTVAVIEVESSDNPPVKYKGLSWIRVGPRRALASLDEERRLTEKRRWGNLPFDSHGVSTAKIDELDLARFELELLPSLVPQEVLAQNNRTQEQRLIALRLSRPEGVPTVTGILIVGKSPQDWFPGAYVQFRRIDGVNLTDNTLDQQVITGSLIDQIRRLDDLVKINIKNSAVVGGVKRLDVPDYPEESLRQLLRNALVHRNYEGTHAPVRITWYSDRVEIQSPGGPFGQVTVENFGRGGTDYRNPTIAGIMLQLRYMERFGVGIAIARQKLIENGNSELQFEVNEHHVLAIIRARQ